MITLFTFILLCLILLFIIFIFFIFLTGPIPASFRHVDPLCYSPEYVDGKTKTNIAFPNLINSTTNESDNNESIYLSLIVPAYNESLRLPVMLNSTIKYFKQRNQQNNNFTFEIIIVDDGSTDNTFDIAQEYSLQHSFVRVMRLLANQGKGGAVQQGMLHCRGKYCLFADSDNATDINDFERLETTLKDIEYNGYGLVCGSRKDLETSAIAKRKWYRNILMFGFHFAVNTLAGIQGVRDTQCGFKLFTRKTIQYIFPNQRLRRWCFDVELLYIAQQSKKYIDIDIPIAEVAVNWKEIPGSKLNLIESSILMARDLIIIRMAYTLGIWKIHTSFNQHKKKQ